MFLNFQNFTSHVLKNPKISLVFLIRPFLIRTECVYFIYSIEFAEVECHINIQNAEPIDDSQDFASANETLTRDEW